MSNLLICFFLISVNMFLSNKVNSMCNGSNNVADFMICLLEEWPWSEFVTGFKLIEGCTCCRKHIHEIRNLYTNMLMNVTSDICQPQTTVEKGKPCKNIVIWTTWNINNFIRFLQLVLSNSAIVQWCQDH